MDHEVIKMSWESILKSDVEKLKQNFINHFNLQGADTGKILEEISNIGRNYDAQIEILEVSGLDANNPSNKVLFGQALNEMKQGKMPSQQAAPKPSAPKPPAPQEGMKESPNQAIIPDGPHYQNKPKDKGIPWRR
jgi:hypothetical protein